MREEKGGGSIFADASDPTGDVLNALRGHARPCRTATGNRSRRLKLVGVAGAEDKTTTACLIAGVFKAAGRRVGMIGALGCLDGRKIERSRRSAPPREILATALSRMADNKCEHAVIEVSRRVLLESSLTGMKFDAVCLAGFVGEHLGGKRLQENECLQTRLFDYLADNGFAVLNADDPASAGCLRRLNRPALTVGIRGAAEITAVPVEQCASEQTFLLSAGSETAPVRTPMIGEHNIYNCLTATAIGLARDIELTTIARGLELAGQVPGRLERIECGQPFGVFVDRGRTPGALARALNTLRGVTPGRLICVFGASGRLDGVKRSLMGRAVERGADVAILTDCDSRREDRREIFDDVLGGCRVPSAVETIPSRKAAIHRALSIARSGDCVLIAGKGNETTRRNIGFRRLKSDDREAARKWLYECTESEI